MKARREADPHRAQLETLRRKLATQKHKHGIPQALDRPCPVFVARIG
ncbi:MAG: hypothetical protein AAGF84_15140 [Planctomycetota bacterium]